MTPPLVTAWAAALLTIGAPMLQIEAPGAPTFTLRINNEGSQEFEVYAVNGQVRQGIVHICAYGQAAVEVGEPWITFSEVVFLAEGVSSDDTFMTSPIAVVGGTYVHVTLHEEVSTSTYRVTYPPGMDNITAERESL